MSNYKFVKDCNVPEPPDNPLTVPNDSAINPIVQPAPKAPVPLSLIASFLPCRDEGRFPCPEIVMDKSDPGGGGDGSGVVYTCDDTAEFDVDFDIESYCCDVFEDGDGNCVDHDKIVMTSQASLTLPYPDIVRKGWLHYLNTEAVTAFITYWNANNTYKIDACKRCWTPYILNQLYAYQTNNRNNLNDNDFVWHFYSKTVVETETTNLGYLFPLVDNEDAYVTDVELYEKDDPGLASLSLCKCTGNLLLRDEPIVHVMGMVRGTCSCSSAEITAPLDYAGNYFWANDPADDYTGHTPYNVDVNVPFEGYLSLQSKKVYASLPEQQDDVAIGVGTYQGDGQVDSFTWSKTGFPTSVRIDSSNMTYEIPAGASVRVECSKNKCSGTTTSSITTAEYQRVRPAVAQSSIQSNGKIQVSISGSGGSPIITDATCYCPGATSGTNGFVSYSNGEYHFFSRQATQEEEPVIREGQEGQYSNLNGIGTITSSQDLKSAEEDLPLYGEKFSTVLSRKDSGTATITSITTKYYGTHANDGEYKYWVTHSMDGLRFNRDVTAISSENKVLMDNDLVADDLSGTLKQITFTENGSEILTAPFAKYTYNGEDVYPDGNGSYIYGSNGTYYHGDLNDTCTRTAVTATDVTASGSAYSGHEHSLVDSTTNPTIQLAYNPQVQGWEVISGNIYVYDTYYYKNTAPKGLYYRDKRPLENHYTLINGSNGYYLQLSTATNDRSFTIETLLKMGSDSDKTNLFRFPYNDIELIRKSGGSDSFDTLKLTTPGDQNTSLTFTLDTGDRATFSETPLNIFNNGLSGGKHFVINNGNWIVVDSGSYGEVPFTSTKKLLYYWEPSVNVGSLAFTFNCCDKATGVVSSSSKVCKLTEHTYPMSYDSTLGAYRLDIGNTSNRCYKLSGSADSLTTAITFTFQKSNNVDMTCTLKNALQNRNKIRFNSSSKVYTTANLGTYWTCAQLNTSIAFETKQKSRIDLTEQASGGFTGFAWLV